MALSKFQKQMMSLTPEQRKKVKKDLGDMMGMPPKKRKSTTTNAKKRK